MTVRGLRLILLSLFTILLCACKTLPDGATRMTDDAQRWSGRLVLNLQTDPAQAFSAAFELKGNASVGAMTLTGPLGNVVAAMQWSPGRADLLTSQVSERFDSLESLTLNVTGAALPVGALFDWLQGVATRVDGWQADLSGLERGRLTARREAPAPIAVLKLILDTPTAATPPTNP